MPVITCTENSNLCELEWQNLLQINQADFIDLVSKKIFRPINDGTYSLTFVGVIIFDQNILFSKPKFDQKNDFNFATILQILKSYFKRSHLRRPFTDDIRDPEFGNFEVLREYDALINLRDWYINHGQYRQEASFTGTKGRTHWVKTFAKKIPLISHNSTLYHSIVAERRESVVNIISELQIGILCRLMERYGVEISNDLIQADKTTGSAIAKWPLDQVDKFYFLQQISLEKRNIYRSDSIQLLNILQEILDSRLSASTNRPQIFGTTAFYAVWEDACRVMFGNCDENMEEHMLGQPTWSIKNDVDKNQSFVHIQIPDLMFLQETTLNIIDAKYYFPFPIFRPGAPDIIKQLYYAESLKNVDLKVRSIFLMPAPDSNNMKFLGTATIIGAHKKFANIEAWGIDPCWLFKKYPNSHHLGTGDEYLFFKH